MSIFLETVFVAHEFWYFRFFGIVSKNMLISDVGEVPESLVFFWDCLEKYAHFVAHEFWYFCFFGTVSRNMLISWRMGLVFWLFETVSKNVIL